MEAKLSDGDVTGAVHLASSNDTLASFDDETLSGNKIYDNFTLVEFVLACCAATSNSQI